MRKRHKEDFKWVESLQTVRHLLVDLDGTLLGAHDFPMHIQFATTTIKLLRQHGGWRQSIRAIRAVFQELDRPSLGPTNEERAAQVFARALNRSPEEGHALWKESIQTIFPQMKRYFFEVPGAIDFLTWARERYPLTLATNPVWTEEIVHLRMKWADLDPSWFHSITHSEKMHACKPSPEYYAEVLNQEKLTPQDCILIGNDPKKDLPAVRIGIPVFILSAQPKIQKMRIEGQKAPAWRGTFPQLKTLLSSL